jgi:homogentisate 1,2-dioxygenase
MQRYNALVNNYRTLKSAVAMSNANTTITIGDKTYTIVEAIEEKHFAENRLQHLRYMRRSYEQAQNQANMNNASLPKAAENFVASLNMSEKNGTPREEIKKSMDQYIADNTWELVDPNKMGEFLKKMEDDIVEFQSNIDFKLSESNATTVIDVTLDAED